MRLRRLLRAFATVAATGVLLLGASRADAQDKAARDGMIQQAQQAYDDFQTGRAMALLNAALDPGQGPFDEQWAQGVHLLAQIHIEEGREDEARSWLRWARRLYPEMPVDQNLFLPETITASVQARDYVRGQAEAPGVVQTSWQWSTGLSDGAGRGRLRIEPGGLPTNAQVEVNGRRVPVGESVPLEIESYAISVTAPGQTPQRVTREVLPGITTVMTFTLTAGEQAVAAVPVLPADVARSAGQQLVKLQVSRFGSAAECRVGYVSGGTYLVTTYAAIRGADSVTARFADGSTVNQGIRVAAYDTARDLAVLKLPNARADSLAPGTAPELDAHVWAFTYPNCTAGAAVSTTQAQVRRLGTPMRLTQSPTGANLGGAVVDQTGGVVGVTLSGDNVIPTDALAAVVAAARRNDPAGVIALADVARREGLAPAAPPPAAEVAQAPAPTPTPTQPTAQQRKKGGFPIILVVGGVAAAGGAAALLLMGGGNDTPPPPPPGETGTITITVPDASRAAPTSLFKIFRR